MQHSKQYVSVLSILFVLLVGIGSAHAQTIQYQFTGLRPALDSLPAVTTTWRDHYLGYDAASGEGFGRHPGIDYGTMMGTPVKSIFAGRVIKVENGCPNSGNCHSGWGNHVYVEHYGLPDYETTRVLAVYAHLQNNIQVTQNEYIRKGQLLGYTGDSGNSTGPHLHFQLDIDGDTTPYYPVDPALPNWAERLRAMNATYATAFKHVNIPDDWANLDANDNNPGEKWYVPQSIKNDVEYPTGETAFFGIVGNYTVEPAGFISSNAAPQPSVELKIGRCDPNASKPSGFQMGTVAGWDYTSGSFSEKIADAFNGHGGTRELGNAYDSGGGEWVHDYTFTLDSGQSLTLSLQDVSHATNGQKTISYLPGAENAYLLEGCLGYVYWEYKSLLGAPVSDEIDKTSEFPVQEQQDGYEVMQQFQYGNLFWDRETGTVRLKCLQGTCEEDNITLCVDDTAQTPVSEPTEWVCDNLLGGNVYLQNLIINGLRTFTAANSISAGANVTDDLSGDFVIQSGAEVSFRANRITLLPGFRAEKGSKFHAVAE